jgi:hypothetical protein
MRRLVKMLAVFSLWFIAVASAHASCNEQGLRSQKSDKPTTIEFINKSKRTISVYWIDFKGKRKLYHTLRPGQRVGQETFRTHPWIMTTERGRCLESVVAGKGKNRLVYASSGGGFGVSSSEDEDSANGEDDEDGAVDNTKKPPKQTASVGFCGNYKQTSSSAGQCANCTLMIADNPEIQKYFVESSTGWSAEATWVEGDASVADGTGKWKSGLGHAYSGKSFELSMTQQGKKLDIVMDHKGIGIIRGSFRCTD